MVTPGVASGDAGQAYEVLNHDFIRKALDKLFASAAKDKKDITISVKKTSRHCAFTGGIALDPTDDRTVLWLSRVKNAPKPC